MRKAKLKVKELLNQNSIQYLSDYEISDIIGDYKKGDVFIDMNNNNSLKSLNAFSLLQVQV